MMQPEVTTNRRKFVANAVFAAAGLASARSAPAQPTSLDIREGRDFTRVSPPQAGADGARVDVVEFFWYGCPHCAAFEPMLSEWQWRRGAAVTLRRIPVAFRQTPYVAHQQLFYALEAIGQLPALHVKVFQAIHRDHQRLDTPAAIADFAAANGLDMAAFLQAYGSFAVQTKAAQATRLTDAYRIDGVPSMGIQGLYYTSGTLAGSPERTLAVADALIGKIQRGG